MPQYTIDMKKTLLSTALFIFFWPAMSRPIGQRTAPREEAIEIAIADFIKYRQSNQYDAFVVWIFEKGEYDRYEISDDLITLSIASIKTAETDSVEWFDGVSNTKIMPHEYYITLVDTLRSTHLPTRHIIKDGKLFFWHDSEYGLTQDMIDVLLEFDVAERVNISDPILLLGYGGHHDESGYGVDYYLCKNNPRNYKRVRSSTAIGWYKPPTMRCNR